MPSSTTKLTSAITSISDPQKSNVHELSVQFDSIQYKLSWPLMTGHPQPVGPISYEYQQPKILRAQPKLRHDPELLPVMNGPEIKSSS